MASITYRALWRWHFHAGLFCIPFVMVLALTGSIYLFKPQIDAFAIAAWIPCRSPARAPRARRRSPPPSPRCPARSCSSTKSRANPTMRCACTCIRPTARAASCTCIPKRSPCSRSVPHTARLTEIVRTIHGELLAGRTGSMLVELAASWAIIMLVTGLYLWWPRESRGARRRAAIHGCARAAACSGAICTP